MSHLLKRFFYTLPLVFIGCLGSMSGHAAESVVAISAGADHTCALTTAGGVKCWGKNTVGQLGNNSIIDSLTPVDVTGLSSGVAAIAAASGLTCALTTAGGVKCWGVNALIPTDMPGLTNDVMSINSIHSSPSYYFHCALTTIGKVKCFITISSAFPSDFLDVPGLSSGVTDFDASYFGHVCVLTTAGGVKCWGSNLWGQLGDNTYTSRETLVDVTGLSSGVAAISIWDNSTFALTTAGGVKFWGNSNFYKDIFGRGNSEFLLVDDDDVDDDDDNSSFLDTFPSSKTPVNIAGLSSGVVAIDSSRTHFCALTTAGAVKCLGSNSSGQLGNNTVFDSSTPVDVSGLTSGVSAISTGALHTCALTSAGGVKCWGWNSGGQLGDGSTTDRLTPVDVVGLGEGVFPDPILPPAPVVPASHLTGLWWNQNESGWGMSITQLDAMAFLAWYTYDSIGQPTWFVMSSCPLVGNGCTGDIYSVVGGTPLGGTLEWQR